MMPKLVSLWRKEWSKEPGTTDPNAAFGIVSLSSHDSEGTYTKEERQEQPEHTSET